MINYAQALQMYKMAAETQRPTSYAIAKGDNFDTLGKRFQVSPQRFMEANPGLDPKKLQIGQKINVPVTDRQHIIDTAKFDPETVPKLDSTIYWQQMMQESQLGKYSSPLGNPEGNTARGFFMMNKPAWDRTVKAFPNDFKNRQHSELATDFGLAHKAYEKYLNIITKDYQYRTGKQATPETMARLWFSPADPYGESANNYWKALSGHTLQSIHERLKTAPAAVYKAAYGKDRAGAAVANKLDKKAYAHPEYRKLQRIARPLYEDHGPNSWDHIQDVRRRAAKMIRKLEGRSLTPAEYAAVLFHDNTKRRLGSHDHGRTGAAEAAKLLTTALSKKEIAEATGAIAVHDDNLAKFPSHTAELLASADANPPNVDWFLNKAWDWNKRHNYSDEESWQDLEDTIAENYGTHGKFNYPGIFNRYYGDAVKNYRQTLDALQGNRPEIQRRLSAYWKEHNIDPQHPVVPRLS